MAAGDLITKEYQYEYVGLLMGSSTNIIVEKVEGLYSLPEFRTSDQDKLGEHGVFPGQDLLAGRRLTLLLHVLASSDNDLESRINTLRAVFRPAQYEYQFVTNRPSQGKRYINARCRRRDIDSGSNFSFGYAPATVELFASDPRIYSLSTSSSTATIADGATSVSKTISSLGNFSTSATLKISGPSINPIISNSADRNRQIKLNCNIPAGQFLRINTGEKTVETSTDGNTWVDHFEYMRVDSQWWDLQPGNNSIAYSRSNSSTASSMAVSWNDAWM